MASTGIKKKANAGRQTSQTTLVQQEGHLNLQKADLKMANSRRKIPLDVLEQQGELFSPQKILLTESK